MNRSIWGALMAISSVVGCASAWSQASAPAVAEKPWPAPFELHGPQVGMFGFASTQPGPIAVEVQVQGPPVSVRLDGPLAQPIIQQGNGAVHIAYTESAQDLQRGVLWHVTIQLLAPASGQAAVATGTVNVQHPPADPGVTQQAIAAQRAQQPPPPTAQQRAVLLAQFATGRQAAHQQRLAAAENELTQRRASIAQALQPQLNAMRQQQPAAGVTTRGIAPITAMRGPVVPQVSSISAPEGVPGDGILINGAGFGTSPGQVHFVIGPNPSQDLISTSVQWTGGQIFTAVPDPSVPDPSVGAAPYQGVMYVLTAGGKSNLVLFKFDPIIDHRWVVVPADYLLSSNGSFNDVGSYHGATFMEHSDVDDASSKSGVDVFFRHSYLQNGWTVEGQPSVTVMQQRGPAGVGPAIAAIGSNSPTLSVFWWVGWNSNWLNVMDYTFEIPIRGPRGLPDGIVCVSQQPSGRACPNSQ